ncbi:MAG: hypothetical protein KKB51_24905 [Candidatus Riflebacteria bacterium]|nr:hypothetical protein [Candidatus Riflebacteria bacterium]
MTYFLWLLLAMNYFLLDLFSFLKIQSFHLYEYTHMMGFYSPLSELFAAENILLCMILAGAFLSLNASKHTDKNLVSTFPNNLAVLFAVLAVPVRLMTNGLLVYDTSYFGFIIFFSSILFYCFARNCLNVASKISFKEYAVILTVLALFFLTNEPWNSPSLRLENAIEARDVKTFASLARKYPEHVRLHPWLLKAAFKKPDFAIIKTIIDSGNTRIDVGYMSLEIFDQSNMEILSYLHSHGLNLASMDILRNAVRYAAKIDKPGSGKKASGNIDKNYPVIKYLINLYREAPEDIRKQKSEYSGGCGFSSLVSVAAVEGDADLMAFLINEGFAIDEDVCQALVLNKHIEEPEIQALLKKSEFASEPVEQSLTEKPQTGIAVFPTTQKANDKKDASADSPFIYPQNAENASASSQTASTGEKKLETAVASFSIRASQDGFDMILTSGSDVKSYREFDSNIFHFLAERWQARDQSNRYDTVDFAAVFQEAISRKIDINKKNKGGATPLWLALYSNNFRGFVKLLQNGADQTILDPEGLTMREYCLKNNQLILMSLLDGEKQNDK